MKAVGAKNLRAGLQIIVRKSSRWLGLRIMRWTPYAPKGNLSAPFAPPGLFLSSLSEGMVSPSFQCQNMGRSCGSFRSLLSCSNPTPSPSITSHVCYFLFYLPVTVPSLFLFPGLGLLILLPNWSPATLSPCGPRSNLCRAPTI